MECLTFLCQRLLLGSIILLAGCSRDTAQPAALANHETDAASPASRVDWAGMEAFWTRSTRLRGIYTGPADSGKHMLVYFDPNCPACAKQWDILQPYIEQVRIQWIPIAYMSNTSLRRAAAILAAPDPANALADNERNYDTDMKMGGYAIPATLPEWAIEAVQSNTEQAMRTKDSPGTPTLGFELYNGKRYFRMFGMVDARSMAVAVEELGDTMDPWRHPPKGGLTSPEPRP